MLKLNKSNLFTRGLQPIFSLWKALGTGAIISFLISLYPRMEQKMLPDQAQRKYTPYFFLQAFENSLLLNRGNGWIEKCGEISLGTYGQAGVLYGVLTASLWFFAPGNSSVSNLFFSLAITLASVPIMHVKTPLITELANSRLAGWFFFSFCGFFRPESVKKVRHPRATCLLIAVLFACLSLRLSVWKQLFLFCGGVALYLMFALPELGVCAFLFFLPFFNLLSAPTKLLLVVVLLLTVAWFKKALCGRRSLRFDLIDRVVAVLVLLYGLSGFAFTGGWAGVLEGCVRAGLLFVWFFVRNLFENRRWRACTRASLCFSATLVALLGIAEYFLAEKPLLFVDTERFANLGSRVCSTFSNPNFLATYLVLVAPMFALGFLDRFRKRSIRILEGFGLLSVMLCIVLTWTRAAWLGIAVATLLFLLLHSRESFSCLLFSPIAAFFATPFLPSSVVSRFASIGRGDSSISYRLYTWRGVGRMLDAHPFGIGVGEAAFMQVYPRFAVSGTERVMHAHRLDLQLIAEHGWIGFGLFLLFFALLFLKSINGFYRLGTEARLVLLSCFCACVGALVMGAFDYIWYHFGNFTLFFALAAWGMSVMGEEEKTG